MGSHLFWAPRTDWATPSKLHCAVLLPLIGLFCFNLIKFLYTFFFKSVKVNPTFFGMMCFVRIQCMYNVLWQTFPPISGSVFDRLGLCQPQWCQSHIFDLLLFCINVKGKLIIWKPLSVPQVNEYLASLRLNTCPEPIGKKMNATFEHTDCMCITVSSVREVRALSQKDVGEGRFWVEGDAYKQWDHSQSEVWAGMTSEQTV